MSKIANFEVALYNKEVRRLVEEGSRHRHLTDDWAETHYIRLLLHNPLGPICTAACLQLDLACNNAGPQEIGYPPTTMIPEVFECAFELQGTRLTVPTAPGIGVKFNREAAKAYPAEMTEPPHFRREDGAYANY